MHDERLTTVTADRSMMEAGMRAPERRRVVDKVAAAVMLQSWLDTRRARQAGSEAQ
jgi:putative Holliday junction resolvase